MAIEFKEAKEKVRKLINFFQKDRVPVGSRIYEAQNPFNDLGVFGEVPSPAEFSKILYARLKGSQTQAIKNPQGKTRVYENERISILVSNKLMAENFLNEGILNIYCNPMYEAMYAYMKKSQNTEDICADVEALNKVNSVFEIALNQEP